MDPAAQHNRFHRKLSIFWWTKRWSHIRFILRELTSLCVVFFGFQVIWLCHAILSGPNAYEQFLQSLSHPILIGLNVITFVGLIFHSITWFDLAPKAMVIKVRDKPLPPLAIAGPNYVGWIFISAFIFWYLTA